MYRGAGFVHADYGHDHDHVHGAACTHAPTDRAHGLGTAVAEDALEQALAGLSKETVWRVKGFVRLAGGVCILNWAFGRHELTPLRAGGVDGDDVKLTVMGERGEVKRAARRLAEQLGASVL